MVTVKRVLRSSPRREDSQSSTEKSPSPKRESPTRTRESKTPKGESQSPPEYSQASLQLHPVNNSRGLIVKIQTPEAPAEPIHGSDHVPCDIVLVIDVSLSMDDPAPVPGESNEPTGLTILDLTKHAALTIIETMNNHDRLAIVTFSTRAHIVYDLKPMSAANKRDVRKTVKSLRTDSSTGLWLGLRTAIDLVKQKKGASTNVPAIMILTDGSPNHMCPEAGYVPKLRTMPPLPATIHTFGFGYHLRSGLLKSIAEFGGGNYAFIPDSGMIGTVFVHAVANLQATYATEAQLELTYPSPVALEEAMGATAVQQKPVIMAEDGSAKLVIPLGNLQYGQSRDIFFDVNGLSDENKEIAVKMDIDDRTTIDIKMEAPEEPANSIVHARLTFKSGHLPPKNRALPFRFKDKTVTILQSRSLLDKTSLAASEAAYHESRAKICTFISDIFPARSDGERLAKSTATGHRDRGVKLRKLIESIPARNFPEDPLNASLLEDLAGEEPKGQITIALSEEHFARWGVHYLPSLLSAHSRQVCNSFKDPGPLQYGTGSPLFIACRNRLDTAFDDLPPPEPTGYRPALDANGNPVVYAAIAMNRYNNVASGCFAGSTPVELASGREVEIRRLRRGTKVRTPVGPRKVALVLKTKVREQTVCRVGGLLATPWHPVSVNGGKTWSFPADIADRAVTYTGSIYTVLLQRDSSPSAHAIKVNGLWGVTLGHGVLDGTDVRAHAYFGDYMRVAKGLMSLGVGRDGVAEGAGAVRDANGLVSGFKSPDTAHRQRRMRVKTEVAV